MIRLGTISLFLFWSGMLSATTVRVLPGVDTIANFDMNQSVLCVSDTRCVLHLLDPQTLQPQKQLGQQGQGPGAFQRYAVVSLLPDGLLVNTMGKVMLLSRDGDLKMEKRTPPGVMMQILGEGWVTTRTGRNAQGGIDLMLTLCDKSMEKQILLASRPSPYLPDGGECLFNAPSEAVVVGNRAVWVGNDDGDLRVFDAQGKELGTLHPGFDREPVGGRMRQKVKASFTAQKQNREYFDFLLQKGQFPDQFPAVRELLADGQSLFLLMYRTRGADSELWELDLEGKVLGHWWVPYRDKTPWKSAENTWPIMIRSHVFYQVIQNEETEAIELHATPLSEVVAG